MKRKTLFWLAALFAFLYGLCSSASSTNIKFNRLLSDDEGSQKNIAGLFAIVQDQRGFIWLGGENGLARYDGRDFKIYQHKENDTNSLNSNYIWDLYVDRQGVLWVATTVGLNFYNPTLDNFSHFTATIPAHKKLDDSSIRSLAEDKNGNLFVASFTGLYVINERRDQTTHFPFDANRPDGLSTHDLHEVFVDSLDRVWIGTAYSGLSKLNRKNGTFTHFRHDSTDPTSITGDGIRTITEDHLGRIWVGTLGNGASRLNDDGKTFVNYSREINNRKNIGSNGVWDIYRTTQNELWFALDKGGIALFDHDTEEFTRFVHDPYDKTSLSNNIVRTIYEDNAGDLWFGNSPSGVNYFNRSTAVFNNITHNPANSNSLSHDSILSITQDDNGLIWIGTEGGLNALNPKTNHVKRYIHDPGNSASLGSDAVLTVEQDRSGTIWVGTWAGGLHRLDQASHSFIRYQNDASNPDSIASNFVWDVYEDKLGNIWVGTEGGGLNLYNPKTDTFKAFKHDPNDSTTISGNSAWTVLEDSRKRLWVGTSNGLNYLDRNEEKFYYFPLLKDPNESLSFFRINTILEDSNGKLWVGSTKGLYQIDSKRSEVTTLDISRGLPSDTISSLQEDNQGFIWASTLNGLTRINPHTLSIKNYYSTHGLASSGFNRDASIKDEDGTLYFGGFKGISRFKPEHIQENQTPPPTFITDFKLFGRSISVDSADSPLQQHISNTNTIELPHIYTMVSFGFSALNFRSPELNKFSYKLKGVDTKWNIVSNINAATYTNLTPGEYEFRVLASNNDGVWNSEGPVVKLIIHPPIWRTWWAYSVYLLLAFGLITLLIRFQIKKMDLERERKLNSRLIQVDKTKAEILANTSHELRTPLNGIIGLTEYLVNSNEEEMSPKVRSILNMISTSGKRLSLVVNEILDFSKLTRNELKVNKEQVNAYKIVEHCYLLLNDKTENKDIVLINNVPSDCHVFADKARLQQILVYLIDNAIKFTEKGSIQITYSKTDRFQSIAVEDTGIGISSTDQKNIFVSFQQLHGSATRCNEGAGLGLSVAKKLTELHGGQLRVKSKPGKGSVFSVDLPTISENETVMPLSQHVHVENEDNNETAEQAPHMDTTSVIKEGLEENKTKPSHTIHSVIYNSHLYDENFDTTELTPKAKKILVVDDDKINRMVILAHLSKHKFSAIEACDGEEALSVLSENPDIDLIILDVMMPKMTGYEACERLRLEHRIHELPVIFITAIHGDDELLKGFAHGGNDFISKPVSDSVLIEHMKKHLFLSQSYRHALGDDTPYGVNVTLDAPTTHIPTLGLQQAIKRILNNLFNTIERIDCVSYWELKEGTNYALVDALSVSQVTQRDLDNEMGLPPINIQVLSQFIEIAKADNSAIDFKKLAKTGLLGETTKNAEIVLGEVIYINANIYGFIVIAHLGDESFSDFDKKILTQFGQHITAASIKHRAQSKQTSLLDRAETA